LKKEVRRCEELEQKVEFLEKQKMKVESDRAEMQLNYTEQIKLLQTEAKDMKIKE